MNGTSKNGKVCNFEKTYPGCLGRMVNLFELNLGVSANRLLTDRPHRDGSPISRTSSDVSRVSPSVDQAEENAVAAGLRNISSNRTSNGTPMKMLIAQEMSKEADSRRNPPNLVAKLMGLDSLPPQDAESMMQRSHTKTHPRSHSDIPMSNWEQQNGFVHYVDSSEYKDVYEVWEQSPKCVHKGRHNGTADEKRMVLIRQKFAEAKRLSMDEKLRQSKQFQDALEVLNSNRDLLLECMQEPSSLLSQQLYNLPSLSHHLEGKCITVLKPSKAAEGNNLDGSGDKEGKHKRMGTFVQPNRLEKGPPESSPPGSWNKYDSPTEPTRIVVLKPSLGNINDKALGSPRSQSARIHSEDFFGDVEDNVNKELQEVAKTVALQVQEKHERRHRDEVLVSSVFSNAYVADESSFNKSEIEFPTGILTDSEVMSPVSRQSWDYANRLGSPYSTSSFSRASYSPESSVCREAKRRLSERWAMMASNGSSQEHRPVRKSSSTLGEMLALSEAKKSTMIGKEDSSNEGPVNLHYLLGGKQGTDENMDDLSRSLTRSKSLPVSSTSRISSDVSASDKGNITPKEEIKTRRTKASFKGKVSSLFFSRSKKTSKDKSHKSESKDDLCSTKSVINKGPNRSSSVLMEQSGEPSLSDLIYKQSMLPSQMEVPMEMPIALGNHGENLDQPSPISVLDPLFEDNEHGEKVSPLYAEPDPHGFELPLNPITSNLIDKSPPIGSIARTLSRDDSCVGTASSYPKRESLTTRGMEGEQQDWISFVKTLLTVAGLQNEVPSNSFLARFYSPECPLDPSLRDKYINSNDKETFHEAIRRQKRSLQKLVFDCVNAALADIASSGQQASPITESNNCTLESTSSTMLDQVWAKLHTWFSGQMRYVPEDCGDDNSLVVERTVQREVVGKGWDDNSRLELNNLGVEIEGKMMEELVNETVVELTGREFEFVSR
ncbi:uncharacterized protein LOC127244167 [Andrographis paniculata]|uniref:uncharacterized protein LOC127244167 n=1 Tax=Andrographis paniculata TaxID=175694 RepID=UPI0021E8BF4C|nr:uncharacterized protein LOC127244167 [Andrographis paniculata]XP_051120526.1 uncharacterized protein LOC127244167 [Andrographis paniculata]XP_051120527.1 uncharacterized protein LOC127244167 [Andrographis paniculata]